MRRKDIEATKELKKGLKRREAFVISGGTMYEDFWTCCATRKMALMTCTGGSRKCRIILLQAWRKHEQRTASRKEDLPHWIKQSEEFGSKYWMAMKRVRC